MSATTESIATSSNTQQQQQDNTTSNTTTAANATTSTNTTTTTTTTATITTIVPKQKISNAKKQLNNALSTSAKRIQKELAEITLDPPPNCSGMCKVVLYLMLHHQLILFLFLSRTKR